MLDLYINVLMLGLVTNIRPYCKQNIHHSIEREKPYNMESSNLPRAFAFLLISQKPKFWGKKSHHTNVFGTHCIGFFCIKLSLIYRDYSCVTNWTFKCRPSITYCRQLCKNHQKMTKNCHFEYMGETKTETVVQPYMLMAQYWYQPIARKTVHLLIIPQEHDAQHDTTYSRNWYENWTSTV